ALKDRLSERGALGRLIEAVRDGASRTLVVRGDPGVGKTVLLEHLAGQASSSGYRVERAAGVQSEMELAFGGLHQLCGPMLGCAGRLPMPQRDALRTAFGLAAGPPPDRFFVGLAALAEVTDPAADPDRLPGTGPRPQPGRTRTSLRSWSAALGRRRPGAGWPRPRRSWSGRCCSPPIRPGTPNASSRRRRPACRPARSARPWTCW